MGAGGWTAAKQVLWLVLPVVVAGVLHMLVVKRQLLASFAKPIDGCRTWRGARLFGDHKTWRGAFVMIVFSASAAAAQGAFGGAAAERGKLAAVDYARWGAGPEPLTLPTGYLFVGALLGVGYVLGELPNSFVKRQLGVAPGKSGPFPLGALFFLLDRVDSVAGGMGLLALTTRVEPHVLWTAFVLLPGLHLVFGSC